MTGGGKASKVDGPLGDKFFLQTKATCKAVDTGKTTPRYIYINNVPQGDIPFISSGMGQNFTTFEGLIPGALSNLTDLNPLAVFDAFLDGSNPDCKNITMQTIDNSNVVTTETQYVTVSDIKGLDPCLFSNNTNPETGIHKTGCNPRRKSEGYSNINNEINLPDITAYIYFLSLIMLFLYILSK